MTFDIPKYGHLTGSFMEYAKRLTIDIHIFKMKVITLSLAYKKRKPFLTKKQVRKALKEMDQNL